MRKVIVCHGGEIKTGCIQGMGLDIFVNDQTRDLAKRLNIVFLKNDREDREHRARSIPSGCDLHGTPSEDQQPYIQVAIPPRVVARFPKNVIWLSPGAWANVFLTARYILVPGSVSIRPID